MTDLPNQDVLQLLRQIASGRDKAAVDLYRNYSGFVYAYVRHLLPDDDGAAEVCQDVFFSAFSKPDRFSGQSKFSTWLCAIAKFKVIDAASDFSCDHAKPSFFRYHINVWYSGVQVKHRIEST